MKNPIIETRLNQLINRKNQLLLMKKRDRGNNLKHIEKSIATLKRWIQDPKTHIQDPGPKQSEPQRIHFPMLKNAVTAMEAFGKAIGHFAPDQRKTHAQIREMLVIADDEHRPNGIQMNHVIVEDDIQWPMEPIRQETIGNHPEINQADTKRSLNRKGWRTPVVENVHTVFRRMNGLD